MGDFTKKGISLGRAIRLGSGATTKFSVEERGAYVNSYNISKDDADVCLNCTKKKCTGETYCFSRRKRELKERSERIAEGKNDG